MNRVILTGRLTKDTELRYTANGIASCNFTIAVDRQFKDAEGNKQADFINCVVWRQQAEFINKYIHNKGSMICVEGSVQTRSYQNQNNQTVFVTEILVDRIENLTPRQQEQQAPQQAPQHRQPQPQQMQQSFDVDVEDNDLPF